MRSKNLIKFFTSELSILLLFIISVSISFFYLVFVSGFDIPYNLDLLSAIFLLTFFFQSLRLDHKFSELGLFIDMNVVKNSINSILISVLCILTFLFFLLNFSGIGFKGFEFQYLSKYLIIENILGLLSLVLIEELIFRGIAFQIIEENYGKVWALVISSSTFSLAHSFNPEISFISYSNIFLAGIFLGLMFIKSRSLYPPIIFHFIWNFSLVFILNSPVSGIIFNHGLFKFDFYSHNQIQTLFLGRSFGIEEGLLCTIMLIISIVICLKYFVENPKSMAIYFKREYSSQI
jgi:membrane protease YdiL (CAAX protease family)